MTDNELKRLKDLPVPAPRERARADALMAALAAFDASAPQADAAAPSEENTSDHPQGKVVPIRPTHASPQTQRSRLMRVTAAHYKIAASITVLLIAAPLAYKFIGRKPAEDVRGEMPVVALAPQIAATKSEVVAGSGETCCGDLETRVAELESMMARKGSLQVYGQVNKGLLIWDDGIDSDAFVADNQIASSRVGLKGKANVKPGWTAGYNMEFEVGGGGDTGKVAQQPGNETSGAPIRQTFNYVESDKLGRMSIGGESGKAPEKLANLDTSGPKQLQARLPGRADAPPSTPPEPRAVSTMRVNPDGSIPSTSTPRETEAQSVSTRAAPPLAKPAAPAPHGQIRTASSQPEAKSRREVAAAEPKLAERASNLDAGKPDNSALKNSSVSGFMRGGDTSKKHAGKLDANGAPEIADMKEQARLLGKLDEESPVVFDDDQFNNKFEASAPNPVKQVAAEPVSTFSTDVDTASYAFMRRALNSGHLPPKDSVRIEELINYFPYNYPLPAKAEAPFQPTVTVTPAPWNAAHKLMHIGIKGYDIVVTARPRANLVFLIDVSGSMQPDDRLPLVKNAFRMLLDELQPDDTVGIVTYASGSGVALEPTRIRNKQKILDAIDRLGAGGSTSGAQGVQDAYHLAEGNFDKAAVNRIILATDGDFNVGITNQDELKGFIERKRQSGIFLSILGVGEGNYNDSLMQKLAQNGNGTAAYVDTLNEARKVLVDQAASTLFTIAKDVKIQVEFNPAQVSEYRLIGYETRALKREDFNNDKVDAGDIGSGHTVTAIYEITPVGAPASVDELRYQKPEEKPAATGQGSEYAFLKIRYKLPNEDTSKLITQPVGKDAEKPSIDAAPEDVRFSVAVAAFGQLIRELPYLRNYNYEDVIALAQGARGPDNFGYRAEFVNLVRLAKSARP